MATKKARECNTLYLVLRQGWETFPYDFIGDKSSKFRKTLLRRASSKRPHVQVTGYCSVNSDGGLTLSLTAKGKKRNRR